MKKLVILAAAFAVLACGQANAQNFLNKMKQKAENAVNQQINKFSGNNNSSSSDNSEMIDITESPSNNSITITTSLVTDFEYQPQETTSNNFGVDLDDVKPASGNTYEQLLAQLPALPTPAQLATPNEAEYQNYLRQIAAVKIKTDEVMAKACLGAVQQHQQPQIPQVSPQNNANPMATLTKEEMRVMAAEAEKIEDEIAAQEKKLGRKMSEIEQFNFMRKNHKDFLRIALKMNEAQNGISAAQMEKLLADIDAEAKTKGRDLTEDEMNAIAKAKYPDIYAKGMAAKNKQKQMENAANQQLSDGNISGKLMELEKKTTRDKEQAAHDCYQFAAHYEEQLRDIYSQIINTSDKAKVNQLYAKADAMVADYRKRASESWINGIKNHIETVKAAIPERIALHNAKDECAATAIKINELQKILEVMEDAYSDFPLIAVEPVQVSKTNITCYRYESVFYPKVTGFAEHSRISKDGEDYCNKFTCKEKPAYGTYKSADGKRVVEFSREGSLTLPGGYVHYPIAFEQQGDMLVWYEINDNTIMEYKYKL